MALFASVPSSQKADVRPISFVLINDGIAGPTQAVDLVVRPEDLTRVEQSRMSLQQTLDTNEVGWIDNFGPGLPMINISGHTGWRDISGSGDGIDQFVKLNKYIFQDWHTQRQNMINTGRDPDQIKLLFSDALDRFSYVVAPQSFTLRRSKSRPLLMQYQISMQAVSTSIDAGPRSLFGGFDLLADLGLESLADCLSGITSFANTVSGFITGTVGALAKQFLNMSKAVLGVAMKVVGTVKGAIDKVTGSLLGVARDIMQAGRNLFMAVSAVMSLPSYAKQRMMQVASAFNTAFCVLKNVFKVKKTFPNYSDWYGASTCSSTAGGAPLSPLRNTNAFYLLKSSDTTSSIKLDAEAATSVIRASKTDVVLTPPTLAETSSMMRDISSGVEATA